MKIIGNKDYYDYLSGIYGIDQRIVLDRSKSETYNPIGDTVLTFYVCGRKIQGLYLNNEYYYGEKLSQIGEEMDSNSWEYRWKKYKGKTYIVKKNDLNNTKFVIESEPQFDDENYNKKENCPILLRGYLNEIYRYPLLRNYNFGSILAPETIYQWLIEWFSEQNNEKENISTPLTDIEKLQAKGFDKITSFRKIK